MKKLFGTDGIRGTANVHPITVDICLRLAEALAIKFCLSHEEKLIIIGKDTRISGDIFEHALAAAFCSLGINVKLIGVVPTPAVSILTANLKANLGIMISASHNHFADNGIKIFNQYGLKLTDSEEIEIESLMENQSNCIQKPTGIALGKIDYDTAAIDEYIKKIKDSFLLDKTETKKIKIVLDSSNGSFSKIAPKIFQELGFDLVSIHDFPNGININDSCGVTHSQVISSEVLKNKADIGIAFDGDGDRLILSDENGKILDGDHILAILAQFELSENSEIVSTIMSNFGLEQFLKNKKIKLIKTDVGDRYISEYMQTHDAKFGGEPSGHIIIKSHAMTGDGLFASLKIMENLLRLNKKISDFRCIFVPCPTINRNIRVKDKTVIMRPEVKQQIHKFEQQLLNRGKLIVRASGTEQLIRISVEGEDEKELKNISEVIASTIEGLAS